MVTYIPEFTFLKNEAFIWIHQKMSTSMVIDEIITGNQVATWPQQMLGFIISFQISPSENDSCPRWVSSVG